MGRCGALGTTPPRAPSMADTSLPSERANPSGSALFIANATNPSPKVISW